MRSLFHTVEHGHQVTSDKVEDAHLTIDAARQNERALYVQVKCEDVVFDVRRHKESRLIKELRGLPDGEERGRFVMALVTAVRLNFRNGFSCLLSELAPELLGLVLATLRVNARFVFRVEVESVDEAAAVCLVYRHEPALLQLD